MSDLHDIDLLLAEAGFPQSSDPDDGGVVVRLRQLISSHRSDRHDAQHYAQLCQDAHDALDSFGVPQNGTPADRIRKHGRRE